MHLAGDVQVGGVKGPDAVTFMLRSLVTVLSTHISHTFPHISHTCPRPAPQGATDKALTDAAREAIASSFPAASTPGPIPLAREAKVLRWGSTSDRRAGGGFAAGFSHLGPLASPDDLLACAAPVKDRLCFTGTGVQGKVCHITSLPRLLTRRSCHPSPWPRFTYTALPEVATGSIRFLNKCSLALDI